jgi:hypothetical protein
MRVATTNTNCVRISISLELAISRPGCGGVAAISVATIGCIYGNSDQNHGSGQ